MIVTQEEYVNAKEIMEEIQHLPREAQRTIVNILHGAVAISDMYRDVQLGDRCEVLPGAEISEMGRAKAPPPGA